MSATEIEIMKKLADVASRIIAIITNEFPTKLIVKIVQSIIVNRTIKSNELIVAVVVLMTILNWNILF